MAAEPTEEPQLSDVLRDRREPSSSGCATDGIDPYPHAFPGRRGVRARRRRARGPARRRGDRRALPRRRPPGRAPGPGQDGVPGPRRPLRPPAAAGARRRARPRGDGAPVEPRPRRPDRRRRRGHAHQARRDHPARRRLHRAVQVAAPAARQAPRAAGRRDALPPARARPDRQRGGARAVRVARQGDRRGAPPARRARLPRGRDAVLQPLYGGARRGRSRRTTTRSTASCTCGSRPSSTSSA